MSFTLRPRHCPVCESGNKKQLIPSVKYDLVKNIFERSDKINLNVCNDCSVIYEDPCIVYIESSNYADNGYYVKGNEAEQHDSLQNTLAEYRWHILEPLLKLPESPSTLDVGATGAWSNKLQNKIPHSNNHLVEPSSSAIALCQKKYPEIVTYNSIFDSPDFKPTAQFDLITFFYSLYCMDTPRETLSKVHDNLKDDGVLLINISHVLMENEIWDQNGQRPWVEMEHMARGTPVVYYNKESINVLLALSGFKIIEEFTFQHPKDVYFEGRQETFLIASKTTKTTRSEVFSTFDSAKNALKSENSVVNFCRDASKKSIRLFQQKFKAKNITLLCNDTNYSNCLIPIFQELDINLTIVNSDDISKLTEVKCDYIFNTLDEIFIAKQAANFPNNKIVNVLQPVMFNSYGLTTTTKSGKVIMTRSCLPAREFGSDIFPWKKQIDGIRYFN